MLTTDIACHSTLTKPLVISATCYCRVSQKHQRPSYKHRNHKHHLLSLRFPVCIKMIHTELPGEWNYFEELGSRLDEVPYIPAPTNPRSNLKIFLALYYLFHLLTECKLIPSSVHCSDYFFIIKAHAGAAALSSR
jgi:hypothetical protein